MSRKLALIIGSGEYNDANLSRLRTPDADVRALAKVLSDPEIGDFDEVLPLINESEFIVRRAIGDFFGKKNSDDLLLVYFCGHGVKDDEGHLYLAVKDTEHDRLDTTAIPAYFINRQMSRSFAKRQILILDCCHSGAF